MFDLQGTHEQQRTVSEAIGRCDFPWERLREGLRSDVGKSAIPVEWSDLSRWAGARIAGEHEHDHEHDKADPLEYRERVLGLAWYSGKVTIDNSLVGLELGREVFLAEAAHMVDFFYFDDRHRVAVWNAVHGPEHQFDLDTPLEQLASEDHQHGWFDVGSYREFVGEAWMGVFCRAFSDIEPTIGFTHDASDEQVRRLRRWLLADEGWWFGIDGSDVYHDQHAGIDHDVEWPAGSPPRGRRPCLVCRPG